MASLPDESDAQASQPAGPAAEGVPRGSSIGRYLVLSRLGQGGMGVVYAAYDADLDRKVAIKLLRPSGDGGTGGHDRLLREAQAMARVSHPNVIAVHDVGSFGKQVFVAMDLIDGTTLLQWARKARPWQEVVKVFTEAGRGLKAAHEAGLVHRDFKPHNVLIGRDGRVFVTDFGLARLIEEIEDSTTDVGGDPTRLDRKSRLNDDVTGAGRVVGTPRYMAPEQHRGERVDARADQFSFCAALYWALYKQHAFDPSTLAAVAARAAGEETVPLGEQRPASGPQPVIAEPPSTPRVPSRIRRAMMRGLNLDPEARFADMGELLEELDRALHPPSTRILLATVGLSAALAIGTMAWAYRSQGRASLCSGGAEAVAASWNREVAGALEQAFTRAVPDRGREQAGRVAQVLDGYAGRWAAAHREACEATRVRGEQAESVLSLRMLCLERRRKEMAALVDLLGRPDGTLVEKSLDAAHALGGVGQCRDVDALSQVAHPEGPEQQAAVARVEEMVAKVEALRAAGRWKEGLPAAQEAVDQARRIAFQPLEAEARLVLGIFRDLGGDMAGAEAELRDALFLAEAGRDEVTKLRAATRMAFLIGYRDFRLEQGTSWARLAEGTLARLGAEYYPDLASDLWVVMGLMHLRNGAYATALPLLERGLQVALRALGPDDPRCGRGLGNIAAAQARIGRREEAVVTGKQAIATLERSRGTDHPVLIEYLSNLANILTELGHFEEAHAFGDRALALAEAKRGKDHPITADVLDVLGGLLLEEGRAPEALATFQRALKIHTQDGAPAGPSTSFSQDGVGRSLLAMGRAREAAEALEGAFQLKAVDEILSADIRFGLARALWETGRDRPRALALAAEALAVYQRQRYQRRITQVQAWLHQSAGKASR